MRKALLYGAGLIGMYLVLVNFTGFVRDTGAASTGSIGIIKAFQGR